MFMTSKFIFKRRFKEIKFFVSSKLFVHYPKYIFLANFILRTDLNIFRTLQNLILK